MDLSIVVVNWNTRALLAQCLDSIDAHPPSRAFDVWVVDNASADGSVELLRTHYPAVHLIANTANAGFARANNQAIRASIGRYVLLLNSDTVVQPGALDDLLAFLDAHPQAGIVGASLLNADGTPQWCFGRFPTLLSETISAWGLNTRRPLSNWFGPPAQPTAAVTRAGWVLGAALMIRRAVLEQVGLLDENYFMFSEEVDLAYRVAKAGWQNYVLGTAHITHLGQQSTSQAPAAMKAELFRSKLRYFRKQHGKFSAQWLRLVFGTSILAKLCFYSLRRRPSHVRLWRDTWIHFTHPQPRPQPVQPRPRVAHARPASRARVMIFGLDGGTFDVVKPLIAQGRLPHLARLMQGGTHGILNSTQPPITPTAWTSFATGKGPSHHQLFDFERFVPGTYQTQPVAANRHAQHSLWRIASEHARRVIALDIPFSYPPEAVNGCLVAGYGVPLGADSVFTYPPGLRAELRQAIGQCEPAVLLELPGVKPELFQAWDEILRNREQMAAYLLAREDWDLFMLVFGVIDNVQHALWNYYGPRMANYYYREAPAYREKLLSYYEKVDGIIGRLLEHADEQTHVLVMSDHGFGSTRPGLFMSSFLAEHGWLRFQAGAMPAGLGRPLMQRALRVYNQSPRLRASLRNLSGPAVKRVRQVLRRGGLLPSLQNIDWPHTRVFSTRFGLDLYVHRSDKFPQGIVRPEACDALCDEVSARLLALRDDRTGLALVRQVHRVPAPADGAEVRPDLIVEYANLYDPTVAPSPQAVVKGLDGSHVTEGMLILHGPTARTNHCLACAEIVDIAPTVLYLLGVPVPADMEGHVLVDALVPATLNARPLAYGPAACDQSTDWPDVYTPAEAAQVEAQLRALGYVD